MLLTQTEQLCVTFAGRPVLQNISLTVEAGGITMLLGRSGAGKTTLLRAFNRLNECFPRCETTGEVRMRLKGALLPLYAAASYGRNAPLSSLHELRQRVGMVFQTPNVLPMSIGQNMLLPLQSVANLTTDAARRRMRTALEAVGLWEDVALRLSHAASELSGGQQQRLCLARALALEPECLLLDEPTASLDPASTQAIEDLIAQLAQRYAIFMVSHTLEQARRLGTRFVLLEEGGVQVWERARAVAPGALEAFFQSA